MLALDKMDSAAIGRYLAARGVLGAATAVTVEALGGGVSNIVLMVKTPAQCLVLKQALPELRVEAYWPSRVDRALREAEALRIVAEYLPGGAVPEVHFIDEENFIYGMACAPASATLWKEDLLAGVVDVPVAAAAGRLLARMHAIQEPAVQSRFIDDEVFWQLRVDPYYNFTSTRHPSLRPVFAQAVARMKARRLALVHGDYSPKNMFVVPAGTEPRSGCESVPDASACSVSEERMDSRASGNDGEGGNSVRGTALIGKESSRGSGGGTVPSEVADVASTLISANAVLLLDFEVVHWGDPAFDLAFCINHLLIKSIVNARVQQDYFQAVTAFTAAYRDELPDVDWPELEAETRLHLGCLMLARIDGKSPVEYIQDEPTKETVRRVSRFILGQQPSAMADIFASIAGETGR